MLDHSYHLRDLIYQVKTKIRGEGPLAQQGVDNIGVNDGDQDE